MTYSNYFLIPNGAMCRPISFKSEDNPLVTMRYYFEKKENWPDKAYGKFKIALGEWETEEINENKP